ncbi:hypothetical protein COSO111634_20965 [Corallococcus soli]
MTPRGLIRGSHSSKSAFTCSYSWQPSMWSRSMEPSAKALAASEKVIWCSWENPL